uniref:Uncharacterized protein n=1 Tax=Compsopogon caeruleus TaxID=31354 RepID=A0A7S1TB71_9RHOD|mmetsp:Transcript_15787/g.31727  ORF Transcript_15787/g.31727 Transcript_15787/m.31727 type:complete len:213 (+) Transcript_15787:262-900(+)|eukprot:CAMPEP_0184681964 /NCGR_PEP_ID=MMETSP0312-20130426/5117_1 /TAXON_ID=31354 /ORGANISM="Compsopogon coeruleus, Strain SAG 36.94" /LENGTH=212 /DNA_ID=CAMNT_0027133147 /DNA_START=196 /DNA_END=834 /DNA_ORIENTATION=+
MSSYSELTERGAGNKIDDDVLYFLNMSEPIEGEDEIPVEHATEEGVDWFNNPKVDIEYIHYSPTLTAPSGPSVQAEDTLELLKWPTKCDNSEDESVPSHANDVILTPPHMFKLVAVQEAKDKAERVREMRKAEIESLRPIPEDASPDKRRRMNNLKSADASRASAAAYEKALEEALKRYELRNLFLEDENRKQRHEIQLLKSLSHNTDFRKQ